MVSVVYAPTADLRRLGAHDDIAMVSEGGLCWARDGREAVKRCARDGELEGYNIMPVSGPIQRTEGAQRRNPRFRFVGEL